MTIRHPDLARVLQILRPGALPLRDFMVIDHSDGQGPRLVDGSMKNPPTQAEVDAVAPKQIETFLEKRKASRKAHNA